MATTVSHARLEQLETFVTESLTDVCGTMLSWQLEARGRTGEGVPSAFELHELNGAVGFGGQFTGSIFLCCSEALARQMARIILGAEVPPNRPDHALFDVVGELTNMLAGGCKSRLCDQNCHVVMSIPNIIRGKMIRTACRDVTFKLQQEFGVPIKGEVLKVITLGKFD